jgi:hypothetical protein
MRVKRRDRMLKRIISRKNIRSGYCDRVLKIELFPRSLDSRLKEFFEVPGNIVTASFSISYSVMGLDGTSEIN